MAPCFIFLGAKVEEQPRKLEHVLKVAHKCLHKDSDVQLDVHSDVCLIDFTTFIEFWYHFLSLVKY